ncbi:serine hydrolase [Tropicimonas sp. IMCC34043]|uniref:serine hydrolase n=1 Tax=Tropicimonas sp. IMCC34043 TaxID=2248760 RepID=UPI000E264EE1|nr:serine hydrolase [Tropicimonas sp. IMCC34043]
MFFTQTPQWGRRGRGLLSRIGAEFGDRGLRPDTMGLVIVEAGPDGRPEGFDWRGDWRCYPCSLVKSFHLLHALDQIAQGRIAMHPDLDRALRDMILWSSNTATNYVIDLLTGTTGDTLLPPEAFARWREAREGLNRYVHDLGWAEFEGCNITQKLMDDMRYGREAQFAGAGGQYLNVLTPRAAARLMWELFEGEVPLEGEALHRARCEFLRDRRDPRAPMPAYQLAEYLGGGMPEGTRVWSKAGHNLWTGDPESSYFKHDMLRWLRPDGRPIIVVVMTQGEQTSAKDPAIFPDLGAMLYEEFVAPVLAGVGG